MAKIPLTFVARPLRGEQEGEYEIKVVHDDRVLSNDEVVCQIIDDARLASIEGRGVLSCAWPESDLNAILVELHERFGD